MGKVSASLMGSWKTMTIFLCVQWPLGCHMVFPYRANSTDSAHVDATTIQSDSAIDDAGMRESATYDILDIGTTADTVPDNLPLDASPEMTIDAHIDAQPELADLIVKSITRSSPYYVIEICNVGGGASTETFSVQLINIDDSISYTTPATNPFSVPTAGTCFKTGGFTCGLIGDQFCNKAIPVKAIADPYDTVPEANESNNEMLTLFQRVP